MNTVKAAGRDVEVSKTDKIFYPDVGVTKGDVIEHFRRVADAMLPHVRGRPLALRRFPDGIDGEGWFQKEASEHFPDWLRVVSVPKREDGDVHQVVAEDEASLVYLANQGVLEFHVWPATADDLERPDLLVLDLDPPDGESIAGLRELARRTRDLLADLDLTPYLQATGGRGYHVVAPLDAEAGFDEARALAGQAADHLADLDPDRFTTQLRKDKRGGRIFVDANRNAYAQTFIAPYSPRARPGAPVATPLDWSELGKTEPNGYDLSRIARRLASKADPWQDVHHHAGSVRRAQERLNTRR